MYIDVCITSGDLQPLLLYYDLSGDLSSQHTSFSTILQESNLYSLKNYILSRENSIDEMKSLKIYTETRYNSM